jgi:hypothetical protein
MAASYALRPSFETLALQAPQDEVGIPGEERAPPAATAKPLGGDDGLVFARMV